MKNSRRALSHLSLAVGGLLAFGLPAGAQPFNVNLGDLCLGLRKVTPFTENNEAVVNVGSVVNFVNLSAGASNSVTGYSASQLTPDTFTSLNNLTWSAFCGLSSQTFSGYPVGTLWVTKARTNANIQSTAPDRLDQGQLESVEGVIDSITAGAMQISSRYSAGADNTTNYVKEPLNLPNVTQGQNVGAYIAGSDSTKGTFEDNWVDNNFSPINAENSTPSSFASPVRSDLYQVVPNGFTDPNNNQTSGKAYYVGYFQFNTNGTMSFIRASASVTPPPPVLTGARSGNTSTVSFTSTTGATYTLHYASDFSTPFSSWTTAPGSITGDGGVKFFTNTTGSTTRFYRVTSP